jgi:hypothetical protein
MLCSILPFDTISTKPPSWGRSASRAKRAIARSSAVDDGPHIA